MAMKWTPENINAWQATHKMLDPKSMLKKLREEAGELEASLLEFEKLRDVPKEDRPEMAYACKEKMANECADVYIVLCGIARHAGVQLKDAVYQKMEINQAREWNEPDKDGIVRHKK